MSLRAACHACRSVSSPRAGLVCCLLVRWLSSWLRDVSLRWRCSSERTLSEGEPHRTSARREAARPTDEPRAAERRAESSAQPSESASVAQLMLMLIVTSGGPDPPRRAGAYHQRQCVCDWCRGGDGVYRPSAAALLMLLKA